MSPRPEPSRRRRWPFVVGGAVLVLVVLVAGFLVFQRVLQPAEPSSFYDPPSTLPDGPPGTIIRSEPVSAAASMRVARLLYTSTGDDGRPVAVSGVVVAPAGAPPAGGWPVVAWAHGTTGIVPRCAPSLEPDGGIANIPELSRLIAAGHVVVATDYVGLGTPGLHPYLVGTSEGRAVLDSVRAARTFLGGRTSSTTAVFGHSQGGHATLFAAALAPTYAPELRLVGAAPMAPPTDLGTLMLLDVAEPAGIVLTALALTSWSQLFPEAQEDAVTDAVARPFVANLGANCLVESFAGELSVLPDVIALKAAFLSADPRDVPGWSTLLTTNSPGAAAVPVPMLVAQGLADDLVRPDVTSEYVREQCAAGASIQYDTYPGVGHFQVRTVAAEEVVSWLIARTAGEPVSKGCSDHVAG
jgi:pimeloyl-ACP methyl ester carboxylesterase